jgi:hypothetical protein
MIWEFDLSGNRAPSFTAEFRMTSASFSSGFLKRFIARKLLRIHIGTKNLQNFSRNQFAVVVPRRASVKVSTSVRVSK